MSNAIDEYDVRQRRERMREQTKDEATAILTLAGLRPERLWELANQYWPDVPSYDDVRRPWWLAKTSIGLIQIGWRKRVLEIDWKETGVEVTVTPDNVTKGSTMVHAWSTEKAVQYLTRLREAARESGKAGG